MYSGTPIIGITGGIGSGKSFIARCFGELGCHVIDADEQVRTAYRDPKVLETIRERWGPAAILPTGEADRAFIADTVFKDPTQRVRLEQLLHPLVQQAREREMAEIIRVGSPVAFVWDVPLLLEAGLAGACDCVVF